ncbi:PREDICTED: zinc finger protein 474-like [Dufourea novaeangliae]|uniref:zinc finger protein 474-like n=1 Tax=Dufourea novaeangliae TaxID=178035 RepID=UPI00076782F6|nr:PREDICTED: zinc finger protein 474-like [Dufourea novaeangliae]
MKWKKSPTEFLPEKTFLVIKDDLSMLEKKGQQRGKSKTPDTGTWPPKCKRDQSLYDDPERPKTANLEKPSVLDPKLVDKLDMSLLSKELFSDSMTRYRHAKAISGGASSSRCRENVTIGGEQQQQQQRPTSNGTGTASWGNNNGFASVRHKRRSFEQILDARIGQLDVTAESPRMQKQARITGQDVPRKTTIDNRKLDDNNNRNGTTGHKVPSLSTLKKKVSRPTIQNDLEVFTSTSSRGAPEPCKSCGKPDQPERFHSHPKGTQQKLKDSPTNSKTKTTFPKSVQKPVALNFRSDKNKNRVEEIVQEGKVKSYSPRGPDNPPSRPSSAPVKKGPRTITCYICGREFGTASFPIHEPRCMQKWERENNSLPVNQRRPTPQRPDVAIDHSEWNAVAWEQSQAQLLPCPKCGRTFLPERLLVHQKSCKASPKNSDIEKSESSTTEKSVNASRAGPPTVTCQNCGRNFGTKSIRIHEPQCVKRSQVENVRQPVHLRKKEPHVPAKLETVSMQELSTSPTGDQQKRTVTCYICGRDFGSSSITIHEPQCLKKWHAENDKLPSGQRRKEPQRPDVIYNRDPETGNAVIDVMAMAEASWKSHLNQLVPCKHCGRTFNPDRVIVHERSCKGNR